MIKFFTVLLALIMVLSLAACGGGGKKPPGETDKSGESWPSISI